MKKIDDRILTELQEKSVLLYGPFAILVMNADGVAVYGTKTSIPLSYFEEED